MFGARTGCLLLAIDMGSNEKVYDRNGGARWSVVSNGGNIILKPYILIFVFLIIFLIFICYITCVFLLVFSKFGTEAVLKYYISARENLVKPSLSVVVPFISSILLPEIISFYSFTLYFSSPEHGEFKVSYCDRYLSVVRPSTISSNDISS